MAPENKHAVFVLSMWLWLNIVLFSKLLVFFDIGRETRVCTARISIFVVMFRKVWILGISQSVCVTGWWKEYVSCSHASCLRPGSHKLQHSNYCSTKSYYEIFSTTTLDYWKNYHGSFGVTHAQYEQRGLLWFHFGGADSIVNNNDIGLSEHLSW